MKTSLKLSESSESASCKLIVIEAQSTVTVNKLCQIRVLIKKPPTIHEVTRVLVLEGKLGKTRVFLERDCFRILTVCLKTVNAVAREEASQGLVCIFNYTSTVE